MMPIKKSSVMLGEKSKAILIFLTLGLVSQGIAMQKNERPSARDIGLSIGALPAGPLNAITDVEGVKFKHLQS
jgi:D-aminopeptidase